VYLDVEGGKVVANGIGPPARIKPPQPSPSLTFPELTLNPLVKEMLVRQPELAFAVVIETSPRPRVEALPCRRAARSARRSVPRRSS